MPDRDHIVSMGLLISGVCLLLAVLLFLHILVDPRVRPPRRIAGMLVDTVGLNAMMAVGGFATAPFTPFCSG